MSRKQVMPHLDFELIGSGELENLTNFNTPVPYHFEK